MGLLFEFMRCFCAADPQRAFPLHVEQVFCARCSGIYIGGLCVVAAMVFTQGIVSMPARRPEAMILVVMAMLTPAEVAAEAVGFAGNNLLRFSLGITTGVGILGLCHMKPLQPNPPSTGAARVIVLALGISMLSGLCLPPVSLLGPNVSSRVFVLIAGLGFFVFGISVLRCAFAVTNGLLSSWTFERNRR
jgi:uncharacterized membrane protein